MDAKQLAGRQEASSVLRVGPTRSRGPGRQTGNGERKPEMRPCGKDTSHRPGFEDGGLGAAVLGACRCPRGCEPGGRAGLQHGQRAAHTCPLLTRAPCRLGLLLTVPWGWGPWTHDGLGHVLCTPVKQGRLGWRDPGSSLGWAGRHFGQPEASRARNRVPEITGVTFKDTGCRQVPRTWGSRCGGTTE